MQRSAPALLMVAEDSTRLRTRVPVWTGIVVLTGTGNCACRLFLLYAVECGGRRYVLRCKGLALLRALTSVSRNFTSASKSGRC